MGIFSKKKKCVTKKLLLLLSTTDPVWSRPDLPETTPRAPSSRPLSDARATWVSWWAWDRRTRTSEMRPSPSVVSSRSSTPLSTASSPTGTTWRRSGRSCSRRSTRPPCTLPSRPCCRCTLPDVPPVSCSTLVMVCRTPSPSTRIRSAPRHHASRSRRTRFDRLPDEDSDRARLLVHHRRLELGPREELRAARRTGDHCRKRALPLPRGSVLALVPGYGVGRSPRDYLQLHHEV